MELISHLAVFDDRPDDQLREEQHIHGKGQRISFRLDLAGVDIGLIADDLEDIVADAQRQHRTDVERSDPQMADLIQRVDQEVGILKIHQHPKVDQHRRQRQQPAQLCSGPGRQQAPQIVEYNQDRNQRKKCNAGPAVEQQALRQQHCIFGTAGYQIIQQQGKRQKAEQEHHTVKNHGGTPFLLMASPREPRHRCGAGQAAMLWVVVMKKGRCRAAAAFFQGLIRNSAPSPVRCRWQRNQGLQYRQ